MAVLSALNLEGSLLISSESDGHQEKEIAKVHLLAASTARRLV